MKRIVSFILIFTLYAGYADSAEYDIGGGNNNYATVTACLASVALAGDDIINVYPGTYVDNFSVGAGDGGSVGHPVVIRGVDINGNPIITPSELVTFDLNGVLEIDVFGDYVTMQGICIKNAAIGLQTNSEATILQHILFKDNACNFQSKTGSGDIIIQYCEFDSTASDLTNHAIYGLHANKLTIQFCYFHGFGDVTRNVIKSRDIYVDILYNYIDMGIAAYAIDLPHYEDDATANRDVNIAGNVVVSSVNGAGRNGVIKWGQEAGRYGDLFVINNTFVRTSDIDPAVFAVALTAGYTWEVSNNIFYNFSDLTRIDNTQDLIGVNNFVHTGTAVDGLTDSIVGTDPGFLTLEHGGYHIDDNSVCYNTGVSATITPTYEYLAPSSGTARAADVTIDIGAFEYSAGSDVIAPVVEIFTQAQTVHCDSISITWTDGDNVAVTGRKWRIGSAPDGSNGTATTSPTTVTGMSIGVNNVYVGAGDAAGNWGADSVAITYTGICQQETPVGRYELTGANGVYSPTGAVIR